MKIYCTKYTTSTTALSSMQKFRGKLMNGISGHSQLTEIYRCCADTMLHNYNLTYEQEKHIEGIRRRS